MCTQGGCTEQTAAAIQQGDLHDGDAGHDDHEGGIFPQSRKQIFPGGSHIVAVENPQENKERKKGGQAVDGIGIV